MVYYSHVLTHTKGSRSREGQREIYHCQLMFIINLLIIIYLCLKFKIINQFNSNSNWDKLPKKKLRKVNRKDLGADILFNNNKFFQTKREVLKT